MRIKIFEELDSTNNYAKSNIEQLEDKTVICANFQSAGRGRFTRNWVDLGCENIYMSIVLKPGGKILPAYANLTQYISVCLCKLLEESGITPSIKWPNDVLINEKKICGILAETVTKKGKLKGIVLGIGVNLNAKKENLKQIDIPATALNIELNTYVNKKDFTQKLLNEFFKNYDNLLNAGFEFIKSDYEKFAMRFIPYDSPIKLSIFNKTVEGIFKGFDDGCILLLTDKIVKINMGEIVL